MIIIMMNFPASQTAQSVTGDKDAGEITCSAIHYLRCCLFLVGIQSLGDHPCFLIFNKFLFNRIFNFD